VEDTSPRVVYNPDDGSVMVHTSGPAVTVDGIEGEVCFERMTSEGDSALALWLDPAQTDVLAKMIRYILEKVRITEESKQRLTDVLPQIDALNERHSTG
jgi:hypothetical protein